MPARGADRDILQGGQKTKPKKRLGGSYQVHGRCQIVDTTNGRSLNAEQNGGSCTKGTKMKLSWVTTKGRMSAQFVHPQLCITSILRCGFFCPPCRVLGHFEIRRGSF